MSKNNENDFMCGGMFCMKVDKQRGEVEMSVLTAEAVESIHKKGMELSKILKGIDVKLTTDEQRQNFLIGELAKANVAPMAITTVFGFGQKMGMYKGRNQGLVFGIGVSVAAYLVAQFVMWIW